LEKMGGISFRGDNQQSIDTFEVRKEEKGDSEPFGVANI